MRILACTDLASQYGLPVSTLNITVKNHEITDKGLTFSTELSPSSENHRNTHCWSKWNLFLQHYSTKHMKATLPQMVQPSGRNSENTRHTVNEAVLKIINGSRSGWTIISVVSGWSTDPHLLQLVMVNDVLVGWAALCKSIQLVHMEHVAPQVFQLHRYIKV